MAVVLVNQAYAGNGAGGTPRAVTITAPTNGNTLVAFIASDNGVGPPGVTSIAGGGGTWSKLKGVNGVNVSALEIWICPNVSSGGTTVTITATGGNIYAAKVMEFSGMGASPAFDSFAESHATTTTATTGAITTGTANTLLVGGIVGNGWTSHSAGPGGSFTGLTDGATAGLPFWTAYQVLTGTATLSATWTGSPGGSQPYDGLIVSITYAATGVTGTGASTFLFSEAGTGVQADVYGSGASTFPFSEAASGTETITGTAATTFPFSEAGVGEEDFTGTGASTFGFAIAGVGVQPDVYGGAASSFGFATAGVGAETFTGTAASTFTFSTAAVGMAQAPHPLQAVIATTNRIFARLRAVGAGMPIELDVLSPAGVVLARLTGSRRRTWQDTLGDVGGWSFDLLASDPFATDDIIRIGNIVRFWLHGHPRFAGIIEGDPERVMASVNGESGEYLRLEGRGGKALLDAGIIEPVDSGTFTLPAAGLLAKFVALARTSARPTLSAMSIDFSQSADSSGAAWTDLAQYQANAGTRLLDLFRQAIAVGVEFSMDPDLVLSAYTAGLGSHLETSVVFRQGYHVREDLHHPKSPWSPTRVIVQGKDGSTVTVVGAEPGGVRRESFLNVSVTSEPGTLTLAGQQFLAEQDAAGRALTVPVLHGQGWGQYEIFTDYNLGDWVALNVPNRYDLESERIVGYTIEEIDGGDYAITLDFNAIEFDKATRLKRQVDAINAHAFVGGQ